LGIRGKFQPEVTSAKNAPGKKQESTSNTGEHRPPSLSLNIPSITREQLIEKVTTLRPPQIVAKILKSRNGAFYESQFLRYRPNVMGKLTPDGGKRLLNGPPNLPTDTYVLAKELPGGNQAEFVEILGRLATQQTNRGKNPKRH
jgi:hypothetical protein